MNGEGNDMPSRREDSPPRNGSRAKSFRRKQVQRRKLTEEAETLKRQVESQVRGLRDLSDDMEAARRALLAL